MASFAHAVGEPPGIEVADFTEEQRRLFPVELNYVVVAPIFDSRGQGNADERIVTFLLQDEDGAA